MQRGPYKRYLSETDPFCVMPKRTLYHYRRRNRYMSGSATGHGHEALVSDDQECTSTSISCHRDNSQDASTVSNFHFDDESETSYDESETSDDESETCEDDSETPNEEIPLEDNGETGDYIFSGSNMVTRELLILILLFTLKHNLTYKAVSDLLKLLKKILPYPNTVPTSFWRFKSKVKSHCASSPVKNFYCRTCNENLPTNESQCTSCGSFPGECDYFTTLPVSSQVASLVSRKEIYGALDYRWSRPKINSANIEDIYDGRVYRGLVENGLLTNRHTLTFKHNTDGIAVFSSSGKDVWPIYLQVNELPPLMRKRKENMIIAGLWFGDHPTMNVFMEPIKKELMALEKEGVNVTVSGRSVNVKAILLTGVYDIPAKSDILGTSHHKAMYSCTRCLHPGKVVTTQKGGNVRVFPHTVTSEGRNIVSHGCGVLRTRESFLADMRNLVNDNSFTPVNGICNVSIMNVFAHFDVVRSVAIDPMHGVYGGVMKKLLDLWFNTRGPWYIGTKLIDVDMRLLSINPPQELSKDVRSLKHLKYWKAAEYQYFMMFYSLPCLSSILPSSYYEHLKKFVTAIYILSKESISCQDLDTSRLLLTHFHKEFMSLYGERYATINMHYLLHLPDAVHDLGPLWANSCFEFESANGFIKKLLHGTRKVDMQILESVAALQLIHEELSKLSESEESFYYYNFLMSDGINSRGGITLSESGQSSVNLSPKSVLYKKGCGRLTTKKYDRSKRKDYAVVFKCGTCKHYGLIENFISRSHAAICKLRNLEAIVPYITIVDTPRHEDIVEVPFNDIVRKCVFIDLPTGIYIADIPRHFPSD